MTTKSIVYLARNLVSATLPCLLIAACASGGGGGGGGGQPLGPVQPQSLPAPPEPASYDTGLSGIVGSPAAASFGGAPTLATSNSPDFHTSGGSDSFPLTLSSLKATSSGLSAVSPNQGATASFSTSGQFTVLHLDIPAANIHADIDILTSVVAKGALLNNAATGDWLTRGLSYVLLGEWAQPASGSNLTVTGFVFGYETPASAMPSTGTATFNGTATATVVKPVGGTISATSVWGGATFSVDFASGKINGGFMNMQQPDGSGGFLPWNDVSVTASLASGTNRFSGSTAATSTPGTTLGLSGSATGHIDGAFYGPDAENLGAVWSLSDGVGSALGTVGAGRPGPWDY